MIFGGGLAICPQQETVWCQETGVWGVCIAVVGNDVGAVRCVAVERPSPFLQRAESDLLERHCTPWPPTLSLESAMHLVRAVHGTRRFGRSDPPGGLWVQL